MGKVLVGCILTEGALVPTVVAICGWVPKLMPF